MYARVVMISDTHNQHDAFDIPEGDILVHAGDCTMDGRVDEFVAFRDWFVGQPHTFKIMIGGNHDFCLQDQSFIDKYMHPDIIYLQDASATIMGIKFWGYPWCPNLKFWAFYGTEAHLASKAALIPEDVDVLICHSPPFGACDSVSIHGHVGNYPLLTNLQSRDAALPIVVCGHIHEGFGGSSIDNGRTYVYNVSVLDRNYCPTNYPVVADIVGSH